jgi:two-component system, cell cycle sensor histidine kinase and response regulator CckA
MVSFLMSAPAIILIVDDVIANRETLRELLDTNDYRLIEAADGLTALQLASQTPPDLVLLDVMMPGMDGYEVCRRLRADTKLAEVPVIMVTALDDHNARLAGINAGADDFITKPFNLAELRARVRTITRLNRYRRLNEMQEQLMRAQRLEQLGMLAAGIAHDFNNSLAPILLATPLLRQQVGSPGGLRMLEIIDTCATRGATLVRQMLSFARGTVGRKVSMQVGDVLREVINIAKTTFPRSITVESSLPSNLWPVLGDPTQINQVFMNLAINARDAMAQGGELTISAANLTLDGATPVEIKGGRPGNFIMVEVRDTGAGIAAELLERIWEPFFTTKSENKGTGLGLSTVRGIVRQYEGFVDVKTIPGETAGHGTAFRIYLPSAVVQNTIDGGTSALRAPAKRGNGELILVVDDEESVREVSACILIRQGYRVVTAIDGLNAISVFEQRAKDVRLLLTDNDMPLMGGTAMIAALRRTNPDLPVIVMSGGERCEEAHRGIATAYMPKPFSPETLMSIVGRILDAARPALPCVAEA